MNRAMALVGGMALLFLAAIPAAGEEPAPAGSLWMQKKLTYSREMLAAIAAGDFDEIAKNAELMGGLSKVEGFVRARTPGYRTQLSHFEEANAELLRQSKRDNLEGVTLAFHQLVTSCVKCHEQLRAAGKLPADGGERK